MDRLDSLIVRTDSLVQRGDSLESDPLAIERAAREEHGLIRDGEVVFHHLPLSSLLTTAADAGWALSALEEAPLGAAAIARDPGYVGQEGIPRYLAVRWVRSNQTA